MKAESIKQLDEAARTRLREELAKACEVMERGGVIIYPTDTIWGIGCDATNPQAVEKVFRIKQRDDSKALITLVPSEAWIERYVEEVPEIAWELMDVAVDPLTIIYDKARNVAPNLPASDGSIALRVTRELFSNELAKRFKRPVVSTSANISGEPAPRFFNEITPQVIERVDYVVDWRRHDIEPHKPSGIIKLGRGGLIKIIR